MRFPYSCICRKNFFYKTETTDTTDTTIWKPGLNETWLNSSWTDSELQIEGYNLIRNDRPDSQRGGGTAIYFSTELTGRHRPDLSTSELEAVWLELRSPNNSRTLICSIYRPPNNDLEVFKTNIEGVLDKISTERANVILAGDVNEDMKGKRLTTQAKGLNHPFNIYQLKQLSKEPTRKTEHTSSLILKFLNNVPINSFRR